MPYVLNPSLPPCGTGQQVLLLFRTRKVLTPFNKATLCLPFPLASIYLSNNRQSLVYIDIMDTAEIFSIVALIVSATALTSNILQLPHSYLGTAKGYANINKDVMPGWNKSRRLKFHIRQFRFGVEFDTPVLIVCPWGNKDYPVRGADGNSAWHEFIEGHKTDLLPDVNINQRAVHTVNNELATWMTLLLALQQMEHNSDEWQKGRREANGPGPAPPEFKHHTLAVAIQRKQRSWDNMPSSITKP